MMVNGRRWLIAVALLVLAVSNVPATVGELDPTFGFAGRVPTFAGSSGGLAETGGLVQRPDGRIVVATELAFLDPVLAQFHADGSLDTSFGAGGTAVQTHNARDIVLDAAGGVVALEDDATGFSATAVRRYLADGTPDAAFGTGGAAVVSFGTDPSGSSRPWQLARQADGGLVVAGTYQPTPSSIREIAVARYLADGMPDGTFGMGGVTRMNLGASATVSELVLQSDGAIVIGGSRGAVNATTGVLVRLDAGGMPDPGFGSAGVVLTSGAEQAFVALAVQADGKLVAASVRGPAQPLLEFCVDAEATIVRFLTDGSLDATFGTGGRVPAPVCFPTALLVEVDGRLLVGGRTRSSTSLGRLTLARLGASGAIDASFGRLGRVYLDARANTQAPAAILPQSDRSYLMAVAEPAFGNGTMLARALGGACGNGVLEHGEDCDDGNVTDGDGCDAHCCAVDSDGDARCDAIDSCPVSAPVANAKVKSGSWFVNGGLGDSLKISGQATVSTPLSIDPGASGLRLVIDDTIGFRMDAPIPPGAYDPVSRTGWTVRQSSNVATWKWAGFATDGIRKVKLRMLGASGIVKFQLEGKFTGRYSTLAHDPPVVVTLAFDPPFYGPGRCAELHFPGPPGPQCTVGSSSMSCR